MIRGLYTAASGMITTLMANDTLANNLSNVNTTGFKRNTLTYQSFPEVMVNKMTAEGTEQIGTVATGSHVRDSRVMFEQGALTETGNTFDLGLTGDGFFTVFSEDPGTQEVKEYYTRAGKFTVNSEGFLTTLDGKFVKGQLGKILMSLDEGPFLINKRGEELQQKTEVLTPSSLLGFKDNQSLTKAGESLFEASDISEQLPPANPAEYPGYDMHQGMLERSNTNAIQELV